MRWGHGIISVLMFVCWLANRIPTGTDRIAWILLTGVFAGLANMGADIHALKKNKEER